MEAIPATPETKGQWRVYAAVMLPLVAATLLFVHWGAARIGIDAGDDTATLFQSPLLTLHALPWYLHGPGEEWGPLYMAWFRLLALVCPQPYRLYFFDWQVVAAMVALLAPLLRVRNGWLYTLCALTLPVLVTGPYMALFAAVFPVLAVSWLLRRERSYSTALTAGAVLCFVMEFVRPEYAYGLYLTAVGVWIAVLLEWRAGVRLRLCCSKAMLVLLLAAAMHWAQAGAVNRSGMAFEQHFNLRAQQAGQLVAGTSPWSSNYAQLRFGVDVTHHPDDTTAVLADFIRANPRLFAQHVLHNLRDRRTLAMMLLFGVGTMWPWLSCSTRPLRPVGMMLLLVCAAPAAGIIIIYPRDHYPVPVTPALLLLAVQAWGLFGPRRLTWPIAAAVAVVLLGFTELERLRFNAEPFPAQRSTQAGVVCAMTFDPDMRGIAAEVYMPPPNVAGYLGHGLHSAPYGQVQTWPQLEEWVRQERPVLVELDSWTEANMLVTASQVDSFLQHGMGYTPHACGAAGEWTVYTR